MECGRKGYGENNKEKVQDGIEQTETQAAFGIEGIVCGEGKIAAGSCTCRPTQYFQTCISTSEGQGVGEWGTGEGRGFGDIVSQVGT